MQPRNAHSGHKHAPTGRFRLHLSVVGIENCSAGRAAHVYGPLSGAEIGNSALHRSVSQLIICMLHVAQGHDVAAVLSLYPVHLYRCVHCSRLYVALYTGCDSGDSTVDSTCCSESIRPLAVLVDSNAVFDAVSTARRPARECGSISCKVHGILRMRRAKWVLPMLSRASHIVVCRHGEGMAGLL